MEKVFASVRFSSPLPVAVARTSQSPFPLTKLVEVLLEDVEKVELIQNSQVNSMM